jgi:hypothetical protein
LLDIMGKSKEIRINCRPWQVWFILGSNLQTPEGTTFICTNTMGPRSRHSAQEGDMFRLLEMNLLWCKKCKSIQEQQQRTLWRSWRKRVQKYLYPQYNESYINITWKAAQQGRSHYSKTTTKKARLWFATAHGDKDRTFWRNVFWSDETKIELFGHNDHCYVRRKTEAACKP